MAVPGNAYPAVQLDSRGQIVDSGVTLQFTDSTDEPGTGGGGSQPLTLTFQAGIDGYDTPQTIAGTGTPIAAPDGYSNGVVNWAGVAANGNIWMVPVGMYYGDDETHFCGLVISNNQTDYAARLYNVSYGSVSYLNITGGIASKGGNVFSTPGTDGVAFQASGDGGGGTGFDGVGLPLHAAPLDDSIPIVTSQTGPPDPLTTFITPLVYDTTAVSGGLYAWDVTGTTYVQVSNVVA